MEQKSNAFLETEKVGTLMRKFAVPCIISLLVAALYNIVDQIFIANATYLGSYGNAANNVVFPLTIVALSLAVMIGDGCCAFVSISLGADNKEDAHKSIGCSIVLCVLVSAIITAIYFIFQDSILTFFGGRVNEETAAINNMIVKYGALDAIFGQAEYAQIPMAVVGIVMKFFQIVISISVGLAAGCIPIVGYNVGAKRMDRALDLFKLLLTAEFVVGFIALLIVEILPMQLIGIFGAANESQYYTEFAIKAFRTYLCMLPLATVNKGTFIYMQSLGKAFQSSVLSMIREVIFGVGWAVILPIFFGLNGVLYSMPVSDLLTFLIGIVLIINIFKTLKQKN